MPPFSSPASTGSTTSAESASGLSARLVTPTTRLVPRWRCIASTVSSDVPEAETANITVSVAGGWPAAAEASSA